MKLSAFAPVFLLSLGTLTACGGGGDGDSAPVPDTTAPVITLNGESSLTHSAGTAYADLGATASDSKDGTVSVTMSGSVNSDVVNSYTITYSATDAAGNKTSLTRIVNVVDTTAPVISLEGDSEVTHSAGTDYVDAGATATDSIDGDVEVTTSGSVDSTTLGSYTFTYTATDAAGNSSTETRVVKVVDDTAPVITLTGDAVIEYRLGDVYSEQGATATDTVDGSVEVTTDGEVNTSALGDYIITYSASDNALNVSSVTRKISVVKAPDNIAPKVNVIFPPKNSLTQGESVIVSGNASDEGEGVKSVLVNGVKATTNDNFVNWSAVVPLEIGDNTLSILVTDAAENSNIVEVASQIKSQPITTNQPYSIEFDDQNNRLVTMMWNPSTLKKALISVEPASGEFTVISDDNTPGVNTLLELGSSFVLDSANNRALVTSTEQILAVDLTTGLRTVLSGENIPNLNNPIENTPADIVVDKVNNRAIILNGRNSTAQLLTIDLVTGNRTVLSDNATPNTDNPFSFFRGIELDAANNRAFVMTGSQILIVDLTSGERTKLSGLGVPNASNAISYSQNPSMTFDSVNNRLIVADQKSGAIFSVNPTTKEQDLLFDSSQGDNASILSKPTDITLDITSNRLLMTDDEYSSIISLNLTTKVLTSIFNGIPSTKQLIESSSPITFDASNDRFILSNYKDVFTINAESGESSVLASNGYHAHNSISASILDNSINKIITATNNGIEKNNLSTGERTLFSGRGVPNNVNNFYSLSDIVLDKANNRYLASDQSLGAIFSIDLVTGSRSILSDLATPNDSSPLSQPINIELDKDNNRLLVLDRALTAIISVDLTTGARNTLWDNDFLNANTNLLDPRDLVYDKANNKVFVVDVSLKALISIDLATGTSSVVSDNVTPDSVNVLSRPKNLALDSDNNRILVLDSSNKKIYSVDLNSGSRGILSDISKAYSLQSLLFDKENNRAIVSNGGFPFEVNLADGAHEIKYIDNSKVMPYRAETIEIDTESNTIIVLNNSAISSVDLSDGEKEVLSESAEFRHPIGMSLDVEERQAYIVDNTNDTVVKTDLTNGFTEVLSSPVLPDGVNAFTSPQGIAVDAANQRALVVANNTVYAVSLETGARTILSSNTIPNTSNAFQEASRIILDKINNRALVSDSGLSAIIAVDLTTGGRSIVSDPSTPNANTPIADYVFDMTVDTIRNRLILTFDQLEGVMAIDLTDGQRVYIAK